MQCDEFCECECGHEREEHGEDGCNERASSGFRCS